MENVFLDDHPHGFRCSAGDGMPNIDGSIHPGQKIEVIDNDREHWMSASMRKQPDALPMDRQTILAFRERPIDIHKEVVLNKYIPFKEYRRLQTPGLKMKKQFRRLFFALSVAHPEITDAGTPSIQRLKNETARKLTFPNQKDI